MKPVYNETSVKRDKEMMTNWPKRLKKKKR